MIEKMKINEFVRKYWPLGLLLVLILSLILLKTGLPQPGKRYKMYFYSYDSEKYCRETRILPKNPVQGREKAFVDELLLGPFTNRYKRIFARGTKTLFCFVENDTIFVNLSKEALQNSGENADILKSIELFRKNILKNFKNINTVELYIDSVYVPETVN